MVITMLKTITTTFLPTHNQLYSVYSAYEMGKKLRLQRKTDFIVSKSFYLYASTFFGYWKTSGTTEFEIGNFPSYPFNSVKNTEDLLNDVL